FVYYVVTTDGDDFRSPNAFRVPKKSTLITLADVRRYFPLPGAYHFRFKVKVKENPWTVSSSSSHQEGGLEGCPFVWLDVLEEDHPLPLCDHRIYIKATRLSWYSSDCLPPKHTSSVGGEINPSMLGGRGRIDGSSQDQRATVASTSAGRGVGEGSKGLNNLDPNTGGFPSQHLSRKHNADASSAYQTSSSSSSANPSSSSSTATASASNSHNLIMTGPEAGLISSSTSSSRHDSPPSHLGRGGGGGVGAAGVYVQPGMNHTSGSSSYTSGSDGVDMLLFGEDMPSSSSSSANKGSSNGSSSTKLENNIDLIF
ncbi:dix domain protein, partial [Cystoisospora suis]